MNQPDRPSLDQALITRIVEAALLAASQPLTVVQLRGLFPLDEPAPDGSIEKALEELQAGNAGRGVELVEVASGWRFQVAADVHPWVARLWTERQTRYTRATLETLALIAYRQPITRGEIEQVRGVAVSSNIIKALEEREWIRVVGHRDVPGRPELLGTTRTFLDYFGLKRLDQLPPLSELKDFGELEPELRLGEEGASGNGDTLPVGDVPLEPDAEDAGAGAGDTGDTAGDADAAASEPASPAAAPEDEAAQATDSPQAATAAAEDDAAADPDDDTPTPLTPSHDDGHDTDPDHALADEGDSDRSTA